MYKSIIVATDASAIADKAVAHAIALAKALGAELTADYDERTGILAMRDGALLLGTLVAAAAPIALSACSEKSVAARMHRGFIVSLRGPRRAAPGRSVPPDGRASSGRCPGSWPLAPCFRR